MFNAQSFYSKFPTINLGEIVLRDLMLADKTNYFEMMSNPEVAQYQSEEEIPTTLNEAEDEIKFWGSLFYRKQSVFWAIADTQTNQLMGTIGFNNWNISSRRAEISYDLRSKYWRKGIMTKVLTNVLIFAFTRMNIYRVEARTTLNNTPSQNLLEKIGFKKEGMQRGYRVIRGEPTDINLYAIIKPDFAGFLS